MDVADNFSEPVARALQQVLIHTTTIARFHFASSRPAHRAEHPPSFRDLAEALISSASITEVIFSDQAWQEDAELCRILQHKTNLTVLGLYDCRVVSATCLDALITHHLRCDTSPLRALEFKHSAAYNSNAGQDDNIYHPHLYHHLHHYHHGHGHRQGFFPEAGNDFERLLRLMAQCKHLQRWCMDGLNDVKIRTLARLLSEDLPHLLHLECCVQPEFQHLRDDLLEALQQNYTLQSIACRVHVTVGPPDAAPPLLLSSLAATEPLYVPDAAVIRITQRNMSLAAWNANPERVPRARQAEALQLAMQANREPLFAALLLDMVAQSLMHNKNNNNNIDDE